MGVSITLLPCARLSAAEVCGEAVHHPENEAVCDQEYKDTATAVLSSQDTTDSPEIRPQKEELEEMKFLFSEGFLSNFHPGPCLVSGISDFKIHHQMSGTIQTHCLYCDSIYPSSSFKALKKIAN